MSNISIGIVGHGDDKFTEETRLVAKGIITSILEQYKEMFIFRSGHSPVGGIDIWSEELARDMPNIMMDIKEPRQHTWDAEYGYKQRNIDIAKSDIVHVIVVSHYPGNYKGQRFDECYHCIKHSKHTLPHVKSGGCWTGWKAIEFGNCAIWHIITDDCVITWEPTFRFITRP